MNAARTTAHLLLATIALTHSIALTAQTDQQQQALALYDLLQIEGTVQPAVSQYADNLQLDNTQRAEILARYRIEVSGLMAQVYSPQEIVALTDFYASDVGQSVIGKQSIIGEKYAEALIRVLSAYRQELDKQAPPQ